MRRTAIKQKKRLLREFEAGDLVRLQKVPTEGVRVRKLLHNWEGPYRVVSRDSETEYTIQLVGEGKKVKLQVHIDRLAPYLDMMELAETAAARPELSTDPTEWEVDKILGDRGSVKAGTKAYKVRWTGYDEEADTWQALEDLVHCAELIKEYEMRKMGVYSIADCPLPLGDKGTMVLGISDGSDANSQATTLRIDLTGEESAQQLMDKICEAAGIEEDDIVLMWASPPCETFSRANWSNMSRGNHHREHDAKFSPVKGPKGEKAAKHDKLVQKLKELMGKVRNFVMENPKAGLERMWYMLDWEEKKKVVDMCAFAWPFKKTTNLWIGGEALGGWQPKGITGSGRCEEACGQGEVDRLTSRFKHYMALAVDPERGPRGAGATQASCGIPEKLVTEILGALSEFEDLKGKVVVDMCAGFQSLKEPVLKAGARYVAVDIAGERKSKVAAPRRCAVVLRHKDSVLAVKYCSPSIGSVTTLPGGKATEADASLHAAGMRALMEDTGLSRAVWGSQVVRGPDVFALPLTTYYVYTLDDRPPQALMRRCFGERRHFKEGEIAAWRWIDIRDPGVAERWRREDWELLKRMAG